MSFKRVLARTGTVGKLYYVLTISKGRSGARVYGETLNPTDAYTMLVKKEKLVNARPD